MMKKVSGRNKEVGVYWLDAVLYAKPKKRADFPKPTKTFTVGILYKEYKDWIIVKAPLTYRFDQKENEYKPQSFEKEPTFFAIPKGMVVKMVPGEIEPKN